MTPKDEIPQDDTVSVSTDLTRRELLTGSAVLAISVVLGGVPTAAGAASPLDKDLREHVKTVVVIYAENRSFNNLFAQFPGLARPMDGIDTKEFVQTDRDGNSVLAKLPKIWDGLLAQPQTIDGNTYNIAADAFGYPGFVAPLLSKPDADQRRQERSVRRLGGLRRTGDGPLRHRQHVAVAAVEGRQRIHLVRQLLHGRLRRLVPQPFHANCRRVALLSQRGQQPGQGGRLGG